MFKIIFITSIPEIFPGPLNQSLAGKALQNHIWSYDTINIRNFGLTKHKKIDSKEYGGGRGLIMRADVLEKVLNFTYNKYKNLTIYYTSPQGTTLNQKLVNKLILKKKIAILCGRFKGIDCRITENYNIKCISIGDYILSGGELAALVISDSIIRLLPGVLKNRQTLTKESFYINSNTDKSYLEYPLYTKPRIWKNKNVPQVLISGNKKAINLWKQEQSLINTKKLRPDLLQ